MTNILINLLQKTSGVFLGKGFIDKHFPVLIPLFQRIYGKLQKDKVKTVSIPLNLKLKVFAKDIGIGLPLSIKGEYEPKETLLFLETVKTGDTVWDIGANVGYYTVLAAKIAGAKGKIIAFEPDEENAKLLKENLELNKCQNVVVRPEAVFETNGRIGFNLEKNNKGDSSVAKDDAGKISVPCVTIDSFFSSERELSPSVIKMDIEGAEIQALRGGTKTLLSLKKIKLFIEYNPASLKKLGNNPESLLELLSKLEFRIINIIDESRGKILPYSKQNLEKTLEHTTYCNLVCAK